MDNTNHIARRVSTPVLLAITSSLLSSCSLYNDNSLNNSSLKDDRGIFHNAANDYLKARTLEPIILPPELTDGTKSDEKSDNGEGSDNGQTRVRKVIGQTLKIPQTDELIIVEEATVPRPPQLTVKKNIPKVSIQQLENQRWILVEQSAAETWPLVVDFLKANRLTITESDVSQGILETDWLALSINPDTINKYLLRIDSGVQPDTSEIHIVSLMRSKNKDSSLKKEPQTTTNTMNKDWMIDELAAVLTRESDEVSGQSLLAQRVDSDGKAYLYQQQGELVLAIALNKQRAYASLSHALKQDAFILYQQDAAVGVFHIDYVPDASKKKSLRLSTGWIDKLNPFRSSKPPKVRYTLDDIIEHLPVEIPQAKKLFPYRHLSSNMTRLENLPGYLVVMVDETSQQSVQQSAQQFVYIRDAYGKPLPLNKSKKLLNLIRRQLI